MAAKRMPRLTLLRDAPGHERTLGALLHGQLVIAQTMEPGDADVRADGVPMRVRPGWYRCEPHGWGAEAVRFKRTWALVGHDVSHFPEPGVARSAVLLHDGTRDEHTLGCILVGSRRGVSRGEPGLLEDVEGEAMDRLRDLIGNAPFGLSIIGG